jgi:hypothetical protein
MTLSGRRSIHRFVQAPRGEDVGQNNAVGMMLNSTFRFRHAPRGRWPNCRCHFADALRGERHQPRVAGDGPSRPK